MRLIKPIILSIALIFSLKSFGQLFGSSNKVIQSPGEIEIKPNAYVELDGYFNLLTQQEIRFNDASGGEYVSLKSPVTLAADLDFILPGLDGGADDLMTTDGAGNLSFSDTLTGINIDADTNVITNIEDADIKTGAAINANKIHDASVDNTEFSYLNGVTSAIQTQIDNISEFLFSASTDNALIRADTVGGNEIQETNILVDDSDNITGVADITAEKLSAVSTTKSSHPCPSMDETARDLLTPSSGDCVDNTTSGQYERYDGADWNAIAGGGGSGDVENIIEFPGFSDEEDPFTHTTGSGVVQASGGHLDDPAKASPYISLQTGTTHDHEWCFTTQVDRQYEVGCFIESTLDDISVCFNDGTNDDTCNTSYDGSSKWKYVFQRGTPGTGEDVCLHITSPSSANIKVDSCRIGEPKFSTAEFLDGYKSYSEAAGDFTVTGTNWTTTFANATPYKTEDGTWRITFNIRGSLSVADNDFTVTMSGVDWSGLNEQAFTATQLNSITRYTTFAATQGSTELRSAYGGTAPTAFSFSGDLKLEGKPTWADDIQNTTNVIARTQQDQPAKRTGTATGNVFHNSDTAIDYSAEAYDPSGLFVGCGSGHSLTINSTTGCRAVYPRAGRVKICSSLQLAGSTAWSELELMTLSVWKNGVVDTRFDLFSKENSAVGAYIATTAGCAQIDVQKDDYTHIVAFQNSGVNLASNAQDSSNYVTIEYVDAKALLAGLEDVNPKPTRVSDGTTQTLTDSTITKVQFTADFDQDGQWDATADEWTADRDGYVDFKCQVRFEFNSTGRRQVYLYKNGVVEKRSLIDAPSTNQPHLAVSTVVEVVKGDTLDCRALQNSGGNLNIATNGLSTFASFSYTNAHLSTGADFVEKFQRKVLPADVIAPGTLFTFSNLEIGKCYHFYAKVYFESSANSGSACNVFNDGLGATSLGGMQKNPDAGTDVQTQNASASGHFIATTTNLTLECSGLAANDKVNGNDDFVETYMNLTEKNCVETSQW